VGQARPAAHAAIFKNLAARFCCHPLQESMLSRALAFFWLVSPFWHSSLLSLCAGLLCPTVFSEIDNNNPQILHGFSTIVQAFSTN
jgi:hypothetical protein